MECPKENWKSIYVSLKRPFICPFQVFSSEHLGFTELRYHSNLPTSVLMHIFILRNNESSCKLQIWSYFSWLGIFSGRSSYSRQRNFALHYQTWVISPSEGLMDLHWWNIATQKTCNYCFHSWYFSLLHVLPTSTDLIIFSYELRSHQLAHRKPSLFVNQLPPMWFLCY